MNRFAIQSAIVALMAGSLVACGGGSTPGGTSGTLGGILFDDLNKNNARDANEPGLKDWTVYVDANSNSSLDAGEKTALTSAMGAYSFGDVKIGAVKIGVQMRLGYSVVQVVTLNSSLIDPKIINGSTVDSKAKFPFQVALIQKADGAQFCGASLIAPRWVLTAAHCFHTENKQTTFAAAIQVRIGVTDLTTQEGEIIDVSEIINHPQYLLPAGNFNNDIALLKLSAPVTQGSLIMPARESETNLNAAGTAVRVIGWGKTETGTTNTLREVGQQISQDALCQSTWNATTQMLCAQTPAGDTTVRESCQGDSGGPLFTDAVTPRQVGVVSFGTTTCTEIDKPGVYARVTAFDAWLGATTGRNASDLGISFDLTGTTSSVGLGVQQSN